LLTFGATGIVSKGLKISGNNTRTTLNSLYKKKYSPTRNITHHKEAATVLRLEA
jgi:hypothetical protein